MGIIYFVAQGWCNYFFFLGFFTAQNRPTALLIRLCLRRLRSVRATHSAKFVERLGRR